MRSGDRAIEKPLLFKHSIFQSHNHAIRNARFGLFRVRSPLLAESLLLSLPPGTEMVHFPGLARTRLCIQRAVSGFYPEGFPHSEILGSKGASPSPRLIAGSHVLHRRLAPRHPPYALSSLTIKSAQHTSRTVPSDEFQATSQQAVHSSLLTRYFRLPCRRSAFAYTCPLYPHRTGEHM